MTTSDLVSRIAAYLSGGGLFNPELANHDAVRDLIIDAKDEIVRLTAEVAKAREALKPIAREYLAGKGMEHEAITDDWIADTPIEFILSWGEIRIAARVHAELAEKEKE